MRTRLLLVGVVALAIAAVVLWVRPHPSTGPDASIVGPRSTSAQAAVPIAPAARASGFSGSSAESPTPRNLEDGRIEVQVKSGRGPISGALVRLHLRGPRAPNTSFIEWRSLGSSITDRDGKARFAAGPGRYLVSARANGFATGRRDVARPQGERITLVEVGLEKGSSLSGQTVARRAKESVPLVEVILTQEIAGRIWCRRPDAPEEEKEYAISDAKGRFRFEGLAPANYCVRARAPGFARWTPYSVAFPFPDDLVLELMPAGVVEGFVIAADGKAAAGATVHFVGDQEMSSVQTGEGGGFSAEVAAGIYRVQARRGLEAGLLAKPVSVSEGATVSGLIIPLGAGASIAGTIVSDAEGTPIVGASVAVSPHQRSGDSGRSATNGLGQYLAEGLAPGSYDVVADAIGYSQAIRRGITVAPGQRFSLDLKLTHQGTVEGRVADSDGRAIVGAVVSVETRWGGELESRQAICGDDGRYRLTDLDSGKIYLRARRNTGSSGLTQAVNVLQATESHLDFTLAETGVLNGKVSRAGGKPLSETVWIVVSEAEGYGARQERVEAEASGNYRLELLPGDYRVYVSMASSFGGRSTRVTIEAGKTASLDMTLPETRATEFSGVVLEPDGTPAGGAQVSVSFNQNQGLMVRMADEEGRFEMSVAPDREAASYTVTAVKGGRVGQLSEIVPGSRDVTVQLSPSASIEGRVLSSAGGLRGGFTLKMGPPPMRGAVSFSETTLEFAGDTFFVDDVRSGTVKLEVHTADGQSGMAEATSAPGAKAYMDVRVEPSASITGRLIEQETGKPVLDARIFTEGSIPSTGAEINLDGTFRIRDLSGGSYTLRAFAPGRTPLERKLMVAAAQNLELGDLELAARARPPF